MQTGGHCLGNQVSLLPLRHRGDNSWSIKSPIAALLNAKQVSQMMTEQKQSEEEVRSQHVKTPQPEALRVPTVGILVKCCAKLDEQSGHFCVLKDCLSGSGTNSIARCPCTDAAVTVGIGGAWPSEGRVSGKGTSRYETATLLAGPRAFCKAPIKASRQMAPKTCR